MLNKKIKYLDEHGDDPNAQLSIDSTSPGVSAKFSSDGSQLEVKGNGDVTLKFKWDDNPRSAGLAVGQLKVGGKTFKQKGESMEKKEKPLELVVLVVQKERTLPRMFLSNLIILILQIIPLKFLVKTEQTKMMH